MRKLAAIMFTDLVGYSALSQKNEALALELLEEHRQLLRPLFEKHNGTEIKTIGDAFLVAFTSAVEAARCAIAIQKALTAHTSVVAPERRIQVRIGLHVGDVVVEEGDVLGDGVNIAARIEPLAEPGGICLSEDVARQVRNKIDCPLEKLGERKLKNIKEPVTVYRLVLPWDEGAAFPRPALRVPPVARRAGLGLLAVAVAVAVGWWLASRGATVVKPGEITSIAVLPLENLMGDPDQDYFVDGMHEALTAELSKISALRVIGRTSTMSYKANPKPIPEIAEELDVDAVIEGSVLRAGDLVRITAQLVATRPERHLWANDYEGDLTDILSLQKRVARAIAGEIKITLKPEEEAYLASAPQVNPEAYDLYLKGWHFRIQESEESLPKAVEYLEQAVALDPSFARAYALMSQGYWMLDYWGVISSREARTKARAAIEKAVELDNSLPDSHLYLAFYLYSYEWDWTGAERAFKRAIELDANHVHARFEYGLFLGRMGRFEEALVEVRRAKELDPLSLQADYGIGEVYLLNRQYDKAIEQFERILELDPGYLQARFLLAAAYSRKSMHAEALREYQKLGSRPGIMVGYYKMGRNTEALAYFDSLRFVWEKDGVPLLQSLPYFSLLDARGDKEEALNLLEKAYQERPLLMYIIKTSPGFDFLRAEPRFKALMQKMGLTEVFDQYGQRIR